MMKINPKVYHSGLVLYCLMIFIESSIPGDNFPKVDFEFSDKIVHFLIYAVLYILFFYSLKNQSKSIKLKLFASEFALLFTALYGITDELHQYFTPNRSCELNDWIADFAGAFSVYLYMRFYFLRRNALALIIGLIMISGCASSQTVDENEIKIKVISSEAWIDLMPGKDKNENALGFLLTLKIETDRITNTNFTVGDFKIILDKDTLNGKKIVTEIQKVSANISTVNISRDKGESYLKRISELPEKSGFSFNVYENKKFIKSINIPNLKLNKVY